MFTVFLLLKGGSIAVYKIRTLYLYILKIIIVLSNRTTILNIIILSELDVLHINMN